ncbi:dihydrodipicolinate reductase [Nonomuraea africana]|uniref:4-hydroxy-tetrahydrodipicolinate reductase n=1 Tax=Nonomuraea africana TaxID=46171 RepID=A0ABR9K6E5_9ACTN|nr:dihydrodipicolinate reductase [Nonomuraea africana]MBE1557583.1 4-hydroxy-tetrahydrodipicolinate reductase [Nonomuraea africana]
MSSAIPEIDIVHVGLGPIGRQVLSYLADRSRFKSVGAVDPAFAGQELTDGLRVVVSLDELPEWGTMAIHCAGSSLEKSAPTLVALMRAGHHVVSTCEELSNPWHTQPELAAQLDNVAREQGVVLLGTGVNPGYAMDYLPVVLAASQRSVRAVDVHRVQDAALRRLPLQRKVGVGLSVEEFEQRVRQGDIRHVGLPESARIVDRALDLGCTDFVETIDPVVGDDGMVLGIDQLVIGKRGDSTLIRLHLQMAAGLPDPRDIVVLEGEPGLTSEVRGLHGDTATAAVVVNSLGRAMAAPPGLRTVDEIPASPQHRC